MTESKVEVAALMVVMLALLFFIFDQPALAQTEASYSHESDGLRYLVPTGIYKFLELKPDCKLIIVTQIDDNFNVILTADDGSTYGASPSWRKLDQPLPIQVCPQPDAIIIERSRTSSRDEQEAYTIP